ncbi:MAG TPA: transketolase [Candidatus Onthocola stercorigallinarum]|nr:transketolase [Candidatus Onthocola stercorigallinarum]
MSKIDNEAINSIKVLALDMIDKAGSGHPGIVLGAASILYALYKDHLKVIPSKPDWVNRDRFVMSSGHGSALLYSMLYHAGFNIDMDELKQFRKLNSLTPGHPEYKVTPGVDSTTGPLGQGIGIAVGMAMAERYLNAIANIEKKNSKLIDYYTYCLCGDGDLMEGISYEALSFASTQNLNKLIILYDCNQVSLDSDTDLTFTEDIAIRFEALDFNILEVKNGSDYSEVSKAIKQAKKSDRPTIIICHTIIGKDSINEGTNKVHGKPLAKEDLSNLKEKFKITSEPFVVDSKYKDHILNSINKRMAPVFKSWEEEYTDIKETNNFGLNSLFNLLERNAFVIDFDDTKFKISDEYSEELRESNHKIMNFISPKSPFFLGGSADLSSSCKTNLDKSTIQSPDNPVGKNIYFGVREHAMGAILNGMALSNLKVFGSTFLSFSDYQKPAIRMSALMNLPVTYIYTHDSIYVGEDGPTHEPVEQLTMLRSIPNFITFRPADINEIMGSWEYILKNNCPTALVLSKEKRSKLKNTNAKFVKYGAYMIRKEKFRLDGVIIATGSEVAMAVDISKELFTMGIDTRVVSMPSMELFLKQNPKYEEQLLPKDVPTFVIEAGSSLIWNRFATKPEYIYGINRFGMSGKSEDVAKILKFDKATILASIANNLTKDVSIDII